MNWLKPDYRKKIVMALPVANYAYGNAICATVREVFARPMSIAMAPYII